MLDENTQDKKSTIEQAISRDQQLAQGTVVNAIICVLSLGTGLFIISGDALILDYAFSLAQIETTVDDPSQYIEPKRLGFINIWLLAFAGFIAAHILLDRSPIAGKWLRRLMLPLAIIFVVAIGVVAAWVIVPDLMYGMDVLSDTGPIVINLPNANAADLNNDPIEADWAAELLNTLGLTGIIVVIVAVPALSFIVVDRLLVIASKGFARAEQSFAAWQKSPQLKREYKNIVRKINDITERMAVHASQAPTPEQTASEVVAYIAAESAPLAELVTNDDAARDDDNVTKLYPTHAGYRHFDPKKLRERYDKLAALDIPAVAFAVRHGRYPSPNEIQETS